MMPNSKILFQTFCFSLLSLLRGVLCFVFETKQHVRWSIGSCKLVHSKLSYYLLRIVLMDVCCAQWLGWIGWMGKEKKGTRNYCVKSVQIPMWIRLLNAGHRIVTKIWTRVVLITRPSLSNHSLH